jgi:hypothetical protein
MAVRVNECPAEPEGFHMHIAELNVKELVMRCILNTPVRRSLLLIMPDRPWTPFSVRVCIAGFINFIFDII